MGTTKKQIRQARRMQTRTNNRGHKPMTLSDSANNNALLSAQLHALGLYAVETLGDGNCLFRALSDQLYGTPNYHFGLRTEICDWIDEHKERYEPFVEDDRGIDVHLRNMRQLGTYGGHLELSAFAHLKQRNVKVIQPGLVYVIEWDGGEVHSSGRDPRRRGGMSRDSDQDDDDEDSGAVYIAYHDWEHFSSIRNISGPHHGLPHVIEAPQPPSPLKGKSGIKLRVPARPRQATAMLNPATIALPRSPSPSSQDSERLTSTSTSSLLTPDDLPLPPQPFSIIRQNRSPKRTLGETDGDESERPSSFDKRFKPDQVRRYIDLDDDPLSDLSSATSTPAPESVAPSPARALSPLRHSESAPASSPNIEKLTRRQRKALGLPKPRPTAGKIIIPGGKHPKRQGKGWVIVSEDEGETAKPEKTEDKEWIRNGTGRVDVRGFRELRI